MTDEAQKIAPRVFQPARKPGKAPANETLLQKFKRVSGLPKRPAEAMLAKAPADAKKAVENAKSPEALVTAVKELQSQAGEGDKASIDTTEPIETGDKNEKKE